jgi:tetratricopeptide (TPR) repeat protein
MRYTLGIPVPDFAPPAGCVPRLLVIDGDTIDERIAAVLAEQRWQEGRALIQQALAAMPVGWTPIGEDADCVRCAFWNHSEFLSYVGAHNSSASKPVLWVTPSFSKLWWQLAVVHVQLGRLDNAMVCIDSGIAAEADHPLLWIERGYLQNRMGRPAEALLSYRNAETVRSWIPPAVLARALRGQGSVCIELGCLEDARTAYLRSLAIEPENQQAAREIAYIDRASEEQKARARRVPWFVHCLRNPPTDPLTVQLRTLVQDLPPLPGTQVVGPENYLKILKAFLDRGWAGFEESFNQVVPPTRPDYVQLKRDLLREPIFNPRMHVRMARLHEGKATVEEIMDEIETRRLPPEPQ